VLQTQSVHFLLNQKHREQNRSVSVFLNLGNARDQFVDVVKDEAWPVQVNVLFCVMNSFQCCYTNAHISEVQCCYTNAHIGEVQCCCTNAHISEVQCCYSNAHIGEVQCCYTNAHISEVQCR